MIEESMYHKIKSCQNLNLSVRETARQLAISPTTVQKFRKMSLKDYTEYKSNIFRRNSILESYKELLSLWIKEYPRIRTTKLHRKFQKKYPDIVISERAFSNYINKLKEAIKPRCRRYFTPVTYEPGVQIQVDPGEQKVLLTTGEKIKVYFVAFKISYSRMVYAHFQLRPYNTNDFIQAHEACFNYFRCLPKQLVYDQTKLVVIREKYREVWLNKLFEQFLNKHNLNYYICEGYDPQTKGLVERHVREVKEDFLYGDKFSGLSEIEMRSKDWFEMVNNREHSTTLEIPTEVFKAEKDLMRTYIPNNRVLRKVDKQGIISWKGNKYSVPYIYQKKEVLVEELNSKLLIIDSLTLAQVASHSVKYGKSKPTINQAHYIDYSEKLETLKDDVLELLKGYQNYDVFVTRILKENTSHPREQLRAIRRLYNEYNRLDWNFVINQSLAFSQLRASKVENVLEALTKQLKINDYIQNNQSNNNTSSSKLARDLSDYDRMVKK